MHAKPHQLSGTKANGRPHHYICQVEKSNTVLLAFPSRDKRADDHPAVLVFLSGVGKACSLLHHTWLPILQTAGYHECEWNFECSGSAYSSI